MLFPRFWGQPSSLLADAHPREHHEAARTQDTVSWQPRDSIGESTGKVRRAACISPSAERGADASMDGQSHIVHIHIGEKGLAVRVLMVQELDADRLAGVL